MSFLAQIPIFFVFIPVVLGILVYLFKAKWIVYLVFIAQILLIVSALIYHNFWLANPDQHLIVFGGLRELNWISFYVDLLNLTFT